MMKEINHEINYDQLSDEQIRNEREMLKKKVKEVNGLLARHIQRDILRRNQGDRIYKKAVVSRDLNLNREQINKEYIQNIAKLKNMS